jgi:uncharacterized membrane protein YphA (DoxX/SURF4 family)
MKKSSQYVLQVGLAITFIVIGVMILQAPDTWAAFIAPWAAKLIPGSVIDAMNQTAYVDIAVGVLFLIGPTVWIAALVGTIHLAIVLVTTGLSSFTITIRDVGLLAATIALFLETIPPSVVQKVMFWKK